MFVKSVLRNLSHTERENSEEKTPGVSTGRNTVDSSAPAHSDNLNSSSFGLPPAYGGQARDSKDSKSDNATLNKLFQVEVAIQGLEVQIVGVERDVEEVQEVYASGGVLKGKQGNFLIVEEERLVRKEQQLREKETQLRAEKILLLQSCRAKTTARNSLDDIPEAPQRAMSFVMTSAFAGDPTGEREEQRRLSRVNEVIKERRRSMNGPDVGDLAGTDTVANVYKLEEDSRLLVRLEAFGFPILVSTLLSGFTLVLFDVATTDIARQLSVISFALEISSSTVLCLIAFRGQQLYSYSTDVKPLTRKFLHRMCPISVVALIAFALGVVVFVVAFVLEASEELGSFWMTLLALVFCPTILAGLLFGASTLQVRRLSLPAVPARQ